MHTAVVPALIQPPNLPHTDLSQLCLQEFCAQIDSRQILSFPNEPLQKAVGLPLSIRNYYFFIIVVCVRCDSALFPAAHMTHGRFPFLQAHFPSSFLVGNHGYNFVVVVVFLSSILKWGPGKFDLLPNPLFLVGVMD